MNVVCAYLRDHREELGLDRLGVAEDPTCVLLTPRFRLSRHVIGLVLEPDGERPQLVAKLPRLAGDGGALAREAVALRAADRALAATAPGTAPKLLAYADDRAHPLLLETALHGEPLSPPVLRRDRDRAIEDVVSWLERVALATAERPRGDAWFERVVVAPLRALADTGDAELRALVERTLARAAPLREAAPPLVLVHGDLAHPNLLRQSDGRLGVLDWERGELAGLPAHDLFFFLAYAAMAVGDDGSTGEHLGGVRAAFLGPDAWAWPFARRYAATIGLDPDLLGTLLVVSSALAIAAVGAPTPLAETGGARDAAARHMLLWREALDAGPIPTAAAVTMEGA